MNPLNNLPRVRKALYIVQWLLNLVAAVFAFVLTSLGESPAWFIITTGALNIVWTYAGITASSNVVTTDAPPAPDPYANQD